MLMLLGAFVWFGAGAEAGSAVREEQLRGASVQQAMSRRFLTLSPWTALGELAQRELDMALVEDAVFPVESGGAVVGLVTVQALRDGLHALGPKGFVADVMTRDILCVRPSDELGGALRALQTRALNAAPVVIAGRLVGMLTPRGVAAFMSTPPLRAA
jgi:CBS domain-containing protein